MMRPRARLTYALLSFGAMSGGCSIEAAAPASAAVKRSDPASATASLPPATAASEPSGRTPVTDPEAAGKRSGAALAAIELGAEAGGTRWAFPDRSFSAVFDVRPDALQPSEPNARGASGTPSILGVKDGDGLSRTVTCVSRDEAPAEGSAAFGVDALQRLGVTTTTPIEVSRHAGVEAEVDDRGVHAIVRVVPVGHAGCIVAAEYPADRRETMHDRARRFVDSVRLGAGG